MAAFMPYCVLYCERTNFFVKNCNLFAVLRINFTVKGAEGGNALHQSFEDVYRIYYKRIYAFLFKLTSDHHISEEMAQETFYKAFTSFHRYDGSCEMFTWLAAIAKNVFFKYLRKKKLQTLNIDLIVESHVDADPDADPEHILQQKFLASYVNECVSKLPQKYRDVVFLRIYADLPFSQIADILNISENSAKVVYYRAKNALRKDMFKDEE